MLRFLIKLFVFQFYRNNAGFFLFFFFFFFGIVSSGSLIDYHLSLIISMLQSMAILGIVMILWFLYHFKCTSYCLRIINSTESNFLNNLQTISPKRQMTMFFCLYVMLYAPVLVYSAVVIIVGLNKGYYGNVVALITFQVLICCIGPAILYRRLNNWFLKKRSLQINFLNKPSKPFLLLILYYLGYEKKILFLALKSLSMVLLFIVLILNKNSYDNDTFIFFFLLILLLHSAFPFLAVDFLENRFSFYRNLPLYLLQHALIYFVSFIIILIPELLYLLVNGWGIIPLATIFSYYGIAVVTLYMLTSIQYTEGMNRNEYVKAVFALFFVTAFVLHAQQFLLWIIIQLTIAVILFRSGFYKYESSD